MFTKNWKCVVSLAVLAMVLAFATTGSAAIITSSTQNSSSKIVFDSTYTLVGAELFAKGSGGGAPVAATYDGIAFSLYSESQGTTPLALTSGVTVTAMDRTFTNRTESGGADQYRICASDGDNMPVRLLFDGLDAGKTYLFQFGYYSTGSGYTQDAWLAASTSGLPNYGHLSSAQAQFLEFGTGTHPTGYEYAKLNATVSGTTEFSIQMERGNQSMNAFSVHIVPEPATLALLGLGGLGLILSRKRK